MMNHHTYRAPGTVSNYEMETLRVEGWWRDCRWIYLWGSLSERCHPRSLEEWRRRGEA